MPRLILAGIPLGIFTRKRGYTPSIPGWDVVKYPSKKFHFADLRSCWPEVLVAAEESSSAGAHIVAAHVKHSDRDSFHKEVVGRYRLRWVEKEQVDAYGSTEFDNILQKIVDFEEQWRADIRPTGVDSPLLLPECSFDGNATTEAMWKRAHYVRPTDDFIEEVANLIQLFRRTHHRSSGSWLDEASRQFVVPEQFHGVADRRDRWKFTFEVPLGFHYDVRHNKGREFRVVDHSGVQHRFKRYTNVDCHGHVRGGR